MAVKVTTGEPDIGVGGWDIQMKEIEHELIVIKASVVGAWTEEPGGLEAMELRR